jgi:hypothetical protein
MQIPGLLGAFPATSKSDLAVHNRNPFSNTTIPMATLVTKAMLVFPAWR